MDLNFRADDAFKSARSKMVDMVWEGKVPLNEMNIYNFMIDEIQETINMKLEDVREGEIYQSKFFKMFGINELLSIADGSVTLAIVWDLLRAGGFTLIHDNLADIETVCVRWA